jgi:hypothetical protein
MKDKDVNQPEVVGPAEPAPAPRIAVSTLPVARPQQDQSNTHQNAVNLFAALQAQTGQWLLTELR